MMILAKAKRTAPENYDVTSCHKVNPKTCERIRATLNDHFHDLKDDESWFAYQISRGDYGYNLATWRSFVIRNGYIYDKKLKDQ